MINKFASAFKSNWTKRNSENLSPEVFFGETRKVPRNRIASNEAKLWSQSVFGCFKFGAIATSLTFKGCKPLQVLQGFYELMKIEKKIHGLHLQALHRSLSRFDNWAWLKISPAWAKWSPGYPKEILKLVESLNLRQGLQSHCLSCRTTNVK